jgi:hypothetical protein
MDRLAELRARQQEIEREWQWLHDALNVVARARAQQGDWSGTGTICALVSSVHSRGTR